MRHPLFLHVFVAILAVVPMALPLVWTGFAFDLQPYEALGALIDAERPLTVRPFAGAAAVLTAVGWFLLAYRSRQIRWWEPVLILAAGALALVRLGNVWLFALAMIAPLARQLWVNRLEPRLEMALAGLLLMASASALSSTRPPTLPVGALEAVQATRGRTFAPIAWASTLQAAAPSGLVFGAGNPRSVDAAYWTDYRKIALAHVDWIRLLDHYGANIVVFDARSQPRAAELVRTTADFRVLFDSDQAVVAERVRR